MVRVRGRVQPGHRAVSERTRQPASPPARRHPRPRPPSSNPACSAALRFVLSMADSVVCPSSLCRGRVRANWKRGAGWHCGALMAMMMTHGCMHAGGRSTGCTTPPVATPGGSSDSCRRCVRRRPRCPAGQRPRTTSGHAQQGTAGARVHALLFGGGGGVSRRRLLRGGRRRRTCRRRCRWTTRTRTRRSSWRRWRRSWARRGSPGCCDAR
eukprot:SAG25_NODE_324_length_9786_cov_33.460308_14_plen_211_part_00